jgi:hypothetical protein
MNGRRQAMIDKWECIKSVLLPSQDVSKWEVAETDDGCVIRPTRDAQIESMLRLLSDRPGATLNTLRMVRKIIEKER